MYYYVEGGFGHRYMLSGLGAAKHYKKWPMVNLSLGPCGVGCQQLGPCCYAYSGHTPVHSHFSLGKTMSHPAPLPHNLGEDDRPKPSCNKWRPWQGTRHA